MIILEAYQDNTVDSLVYETFLLKETTLRQQNIVEQFKNEGTSTFLHPKQGNSYLHFTIYF